MKLRNSLFLFLVIFSVTSYALSQGKYYTENMSMHIDYGDTFQEGTYTIRFPGSDAWLENAQYHATNKMPACIVILSHSLNEEQLKIFAHELEATTDERALPLELYKGTWTFVDKDPLNNTYRETPYTIKTKDNKTFSQLLEYVGAGYPNARVSVEFDRGCAALATRPYLPEPEL